MENKKYLETRGNFILACLLFLEVALCGFLVLSFSPIVTGDVGENATVITSLQVGAVHPEILNITVDEYASSINLIANSSKIVSCVALVRDYNNDTDVINVTAQFFGNDSSFFGDSDDNNYHYTNDSCNINMTFGSWQGMSDDNYTLLANCTFSVMYYANPEPWNCTMTVVDSFNLNDSDSDIITVNELLAVELPTSINYGIVNSTYVSNERAVNVSNVGNVEINLSLSGYAQTEGDGYAMNCSLGDNETFVIDYEKYNLTSSTPGFLSLSEFEDSYINLTSDPVVNFFGLNYRQNDVINEAFNETYWRIYVPKGVAGTCQGNIVFGAVRASP